MNERRIVRSGNYDVAGIGPVHVNVRATSTRLIARWKGGMLCASAPWGIEYWRLEKFLNDYSARIAKMKPADPYHIGQTLAFPEFKVDIVSQAHLPQRMIMNYADGAAVIGVGEGWDMSSPNTIRQITKAIYRVAQSVAPAILLPAARAEAERIGKAPLAWMVSNGHRVLGHCNSQGVIALSYALMFYPHELRRYVVCHELAHLTEMNHSARFHRLCDQYCEGREAELAAALKAYRLPLPRI